MKKKDKFSRKAIKKHIKDFLMEIGWDYSKTYCKLDLTEESSAEDILREWGYFVDGALSQLLKSESTDEKIADYIKLLLNAFGKEACELAILKKRMGIES